MERNGVHDISRSERRIYLSRNDAGTRRVANEAEFFAALRDLDFESVQCSKLSFSEQVKLFREASVIVGPHGAAMANLIFSNHGARFLELGTHAYTNPCFEYLCASAGLLYSKFHGEAEQSGDPSSDYVVDVDTLIAKLEDLI
ncbi:MAG: glycosyltransferase family 61 protein [Verrucomicrobiota bacterium]